MPEAEGIGGYGQAMLAHIAGDLAAAERRYTETTARLLRHGSLHADRFQVLAVATLRVGQGRVAEYAAGAQQLLDAQGPHLADLLTSPWPRTASLSRPGGCTPGASRCAPTSSSQPSRPCGPWR